MKRTGVRALVSVIALGLAVGLACGDSPVTDCPASLLYCKTTCAAASIDIANCGSCGVKCAPGQVCDNYACRTCTADETLCGADSGFPYCLANDAGPCN